MKTKRILITLSLDYGINMMGFESSLTREQISVNNPELTVLSLREFVCYPRRTCSVWMT